MSLEDIPTWFSETVDISLESAQVILSIIVILAVLLPTMYLARGSKAVLVEVILLFMTEAVLVGIGWMPLWILVATIAVSAMAVALFGTQAVTGE